MNKQVLKQAFIASAVLAVVGLTGNIVMQTQSPQSRTVSLTTQPMPPEDVRVLEEMEARKAMERAKEHRRRAVEEHGEPHEAPPEGDGLAPIYTKVTPDSDGWKRSDTTVLEPTAVPEPAVVPTREKSEFFTMDSMFNKGWGLFQALIVAWAVNAMKRGKKDE